MMLFKLQVFTLLTLFSLFFMIENVEAVDLPFLRDQNMIIEEHVDGLKLPTTMAFIDNDILVLEKNGNVRLIRDGILQQEPILSLEVSQTIEEGLIGILVKNNFVYLHYTTEDLSTKTTSNWFYKYEWDGNNLINPKLVKEIHGGNYGHNSGVMTMDLEGNVYMVIGDLQNRQGLLQNYNSGEPDDTSVIMPIDPDGSHYAIGIRNSFGLTFDPITGFLWDTENGHEKFDEINLVEKNFNSGWDKIQGPNFQNEKLVFPLNGFNYSDPEFSWEIPVGVTAIHFIQSSLFPTFHDSVFVGDFNNGILYKFQLNDNRTGFLFEDKRLKDLVFNKDDKVNETIFGTGFGGITDIKQGPDETIYIVSIGYGKIYRLLPNLETTQFLVNCDDEVVSGGNFSGCNLKDKNLSNLDLSFIDLSYANLENVDLTGTNLNYAKLVGSNLLNSKISNTDFSNANLDSSLISGITINESKFNNASLKSANFEYTVVTNTDFSNANLNQINLSRSKIIDTNLENAILINSDFSNTEINSTNMKKSILNFANFTNVQIKSSNLNNTTIYKVNFNGAILKNIDIINSDNFETTFVYANMDNVNFDSSRFVGINFNESTMKDVNLKNIYPIDSTFNNVLYIGDNKINTCLDHDVFSKLINKILRIFGENDQTIFQPLKNLLVMICN